jgi:hypothetical protein
VWPFLLEVFSPDSTFAQRQQQHTLMTRQYQQLLLQCQVRKGVCSRAVVCVCSRSTSADAQLTRHHLATPRTAATALSLNNSAARLCCIAAAAGV